jgi:hypothetical protein
MTNRLMAPLLSPQQDWTAQLPPGQPGADPNMVAQPTVDPGYGLHNTPLGNLNQSPGQTIGGYLPANAQLTPQQAAFMQWLQQFRRT